MLWHVKATHTLVKRNRPPAQNEAATRGHAVGVLIGQDNGRSGKRDRFAGPGVGNRPPQLEAGRARRRRNGFLGVGNGFLEVVEPTVIGQVRDGAAVRKSLCGMGLGGFAWCSWSGLGRALVAFSVSAGPKCTGDGFLSAHELRGERRCPASRERAEGSLRLAVARSAWGEVPGVREKIKRNAEWGMRIDARRHFQPAIVNRQSATVRWGLDPVTETRREHARAESSVHQCTAHRAVAPGPCSLTVRS